MSSSQTSSSSFSTPPTKADSNFCKFNHNLGLLIQQLSNAYPEDRDLEGYRDKFDVLKKVNVRMACELFIKGVDKYIGEIMTEDEFFFVNFKYDGIVADKKYLDLINKILQLWRSSENAKLKKNVWKFFQILLTYGIKALKRQDLVDEINKFRARPLSL